MTSGEPDDHPLDQARLPELDSSPMTPIRTLDLNDRIALRT
jgi:hypothetical protein